MKHLFFIFFFFSMLQFSTGQISIIGTATPAGNWLTDFNLSQDPSNPAVWHGQIILQKDSLFKFRANNDWAVNWGADNFPSGPLVVSGANIMVDSTALYSMTFDSSGLTYTFVTLDPPTMTLTDDGHVGIGVLAPGERLEVEGGIKVDSIDVGFGLIKNVADPVSAQDAATKAYVDLLETRFDSLLSILFPNPSVQDRLDLGETPVEIYNSDNSLLDSLYGKTYQGGFIAYLNTSTGTGLVAAPSDQSASSPWGCDGDAIGGTSTEIGTGQANSTLVVNGCGEAWIAASLCDDLVVGIYDDWFLPSKDELNELYLNLKVNGSGNFILSGDYWSSTEYDNFSAWFQDFNLGIQNYYPKYIGTNVRAVRTF